MKESKKHIPGSGIRSMPTSNLFRALNFELYMKPNKMVMGIGAAAFLFCFGYIAYMRYKYTSMGYYTGVNSDGSLQYHKKKSNWE